MADFNLLLARLDVISLIHGNDAKNWSIDSSGAFPVSSLSKTCVIFFPTSRRVVLSYLKFKKPKESKCSYTDFVILCFKRSRDITKEARGFLPRFYSHKYVYHVRMVKVSTMYSLVVLMLHLVGLPRNRSMNRLETRIRSVGL